MTSLALANTLGAVSPVRSLAVQAFAAMRQYGMTYIGPAPNIAGDGAPNLFTSPEDFTAAVWSKVGCTPTLSGTVLAPDGSGMTLLTENTSTGAHYVLQNAVSGVGRATQSWIVKPNGRTLIKVRSEGPQTGSLSTIFNLTGAGSVTGAGTIQALTNGLYYITASSVANGTGASGYHLLQTLDSGGNESYTGDGVSGVYVWGAKLEPGSVATAYTPQSVLRQRGAYTDSTGTTPVTAVGDLFGLLLDRCGTVGAELAGASMATGWTSADARFTYAASSIAWAGGGGANASTVKEPFLPSVSIAKFVRLQFTVSGYAGSGTCGIDNGNLSSIPNDTAGTSLIDTRVTANGTYTFHGYWRGAGGGGIGIQILGRGTNSFMLSALTIKELTGSHATQPTANFKPALTRVPKRLGPNLVVNGTFDTDVNGWTALGSHSWAAGKLRRPIGAGNAGSYIDFAVGAGKTYQVYGEISNLIGSGGYAISTYTGGGFASPGPQAPSGTPTMVTAVTSSMRIYLYTDNTRGADFDNIIVQEVLEWSYAISFDGSNDYLQTGITTGNEGWICSGVTLTNGAPANQSICYSGADADINAGLWLATSGGSVRFGVGNGTTRNTIFGAAVPINTPVVLEGGHDASQVVAGLNGTLSTAAKTVNCTTSRTIRIGMTEASWPLAGPMTATVISPVLPPASVRALIRKFIGSQQGQTL